MAFPKYKEEEEYSESSGGSYLDCDSDADPSYTIVEETRGRLSSLSFKNKSMSRNAKGLEMCMAKGTEKMEMIADEGVDGNSFERVQEIIKAGRLEKLKVDQCKVYLRKNGLRLTGNKDTLIHRIMEHQEILNGGGEEKYPVSSFVLNCKGDACTGDVVMFEQNVYETYNIASRSAGGPPCGTRTVAGRIVKESYGAAKQQHTFTVEVLWSKGEKPLPPLHPLLIKGRNLYRLKTLRQRWEDEGERGKILMEKHSRGSLARSNRETRIQGKEKRKMLMEIRALKKEEPNMNPSEINPNYQTKTGIQAQYSGTSVNHGKVALHLQPSAKKAHILAAKLGSKTQPPATESQPSGSSTLAVDKGRGPQQQDVAPQSSGQSSEGITRERPQQHSIQHQQFEPQQLAIRSPQLDVLGNFMKPTNLIPQQSSFYGESRKLAPQPKPQSTQKQNDHLQVTHNLLKLNRAQEVLQCKIDNFGVRTSNFCASDHTSHFNAYSSASWEDELSKRNHHRQPLRSLNHCHPMRQPHTQRLTSMNPSSPLRTQQNQGYQQLQICRYYAKGRCYYGNNCKFLHDLRKVNG